MMTIMTHWPHLIMKITTKLAINPILISVHLYSTLMDKIKIWVYLYDTPIFVVTRKINLFIYIRKFLEKFFCKPYF